jgi:menaquinone-dependent protoporphyrinogen oxidase
MMLIAYASNHESTHEVAEAVAAALREAGEEVDVRLASELDELDASEPVILGAPLYMGRWHKDARRFLKRHRRELAKIPLAVFALGPLHDTEKEREGARKQLEHALGKVPEVRPVAVEIFGGVLRPEELHFPFSKMPATDIRDWDAIEAWADSLPGHFAPEAREVGAEATRTGAR